jgi:hypothetical protein
MVDFLRLVERHREIEFTVWFDRSGVPAFLHMAFEKHLRARYPMKTPAERAALNWDLEYPNLAVLAPSKERTPVLLTLGIEVQAPNVSPAWPKGQYAVLLSASYRAVGRVTSTLTAGDDLMNFATLANADPDREGYEMVAVLGGNKPASQLFVPGHGIGDLALPENKMCIDDIRQGQKLDICVTPGGKEVSRFDPRDFQRECGTTAPVQACIRSSLSYAAAIDALKQVEGLADCVKKEEERWVTDEKMDPVLSTLSQLFVGSYRGLMSATRVQAAVLSGTVAGERIVSELRKIAIANPA